jgi:acyl carrier protein phosphodiesterase
MDSARKDTMFGAAPYLRSMNFLAHLYLSGPHKAVMLGNFLGDFIRKAEESRYPEPVQRGIRLHRHIDSYTDHHPLVIQGTRRLRKLHGHYAPVIIDVFYDYFLSRNWSTFSDRSLSEFSSWTYAALRKQKPLLPERIATQLDHMIADDWLTGYGDPDRLASVFRRLRRRMSRPALLTGIMQTLDTETPALEAEFLAFFPEVIHYVDTVLAQDP